MTVHNLHERHIAAPADAVGALIDTLASEKDAFWPRHAWPAMRFDRPLQPGARGGHGPIRYTVAAYTPGRAIRFAFDGPRGFDGWHGFEVEPVDAARCVLRHRLELRPHSLARLSWPLVFRWLHDACVEDALSTAERSLGIAPSVCPWSPWVRLLRWALAPRARHPDRRPGTHTPLEDDST